MAAVFLDIFHSNGRRASSIVHGTTSYPSYWLENDSLTNFSKLMVLFSLFLGRRRESHLVKLGDRPSWRSRRFESRQGPVIFILMNTVPSHRMLSTRQASAHRLVTSQYVSCFCSHTTPLPTAGCVITKANTNFFEAHQINGCGCAHVENVFNEVIKAPRIRKSS